LSHKIPTILDFKLENIWKDKLESKVKELIATDSSELKAMVR
jgi:hypothetical protein